MGGKSTKIKQRGNKGAGRPRKQGVERYPSGDVKRGETQREVMSVAIEARRRIDGWGDKVADDTVKSPFAGYTLGRIFLDGRITEEQRKAGDEYAEIISRYHRLTGIPFPSDITVNNHISNAKMKLHAVNSVHLVAKALRTGIIQ